MEVSARLFAAVFTLRDRLVTATGAALAVA